MESIRKVTIMGAGYVGVPTGAYLASQHPVTIYDPDTKKIQLLNKFLEGKGELYVHEPGLNLMLLDHKNNLEVTDDIKIALKDTDLIFNCVGTPSLDDGRANLQYIKDVAKLLGMHIQKDCIVLNKSTVPPKTADVVQDIIDTEQRKRKTKHKVYVGSCPEFLAEGTAVDDLKKPSRIVFGIDDENSKNLVYSFFYGYHENAPIIAMSTYSSELTKLAANFLLASKISAANTIAQVCDAYGGDYEEVRKGTGSDPRIGKWGLYAGIGFGGSCFEKDVQNFNHHAADANITTDLIEGALRVNRQLLQYFKKKIVDYYGSIKGKKLVLWGVGYKKDTDDIRNSQAVRLCELLLKEGADIVVHDPISEARNNFKEQFPSIQVFDNQYDMMKDVDGVIIGNDSLDYKSPDVNQLKLMRDKVIFDGKNLITDAVLIELKKEGFAYFSVGRDSFGK